MDISTTSMNAQEKTNLNSSNNEEMVKTETMKNNPFTAVWTEKTGWFAALGNKRLTETFVTKEELEKYIGKKTWDLLFNVVSLIADTTCEIREAKKTQTNKN